MIIHTQRGFIALFSVVIVSFILLLITVTLNFSSLFGRFNILDSEFKERSVNLASACVSVARLNIAQGGYVMGTVELVSNIGEDGESCEYVILNSNDIVAHACVNDAHTFYEVGFNPNEPDITLTYFSELSNFSAENFSLCF